MPCSSTNACTSDKASASLPETLCLRHWTGTEVVAGLHAARSQLSSQAIRWLLQV